MTALEREIANLLSGDARLSAKKIAAMLSVEEREVASTIERLEESGVINSEKAEDSLVEALIEVKVSPKQKEGFDGIAKQIAAFPEVKSVYLMSGAYDLAVFVEDKTLQQVSRFVSERISTFEGVISTATHFSLKKYKIEDVLTETEDADNRICVQP